ncbi:hypothetical protein CYMTET_47919 [Cymbomonas tetramitiformis]|uniref:PH domain-containing protein n=1 Tax=Cymbomonas tetramitiformis TaxID=36881 RepID=A0AAE0BTC6_9CHLO|nr:hypothetical protein CYMTET_47919 [Cymbomonas tetramitiformis]
MLQRWNKRWFFLTDEVLAYAKTPKDSVMRGSLAVRDILDVRRSANADDLEFQVVLAKRTLVLRSKSSTQLQEWLKAIDHAKQALLLTSMQLPAGAGSESQSQQIQPAADVGVATRGSLREQHRGKGLTVFVDDPNGDTPRSPDRDVAEAVVEPPVQPPAADLNTRALGAQRSRYNPEMIESDYEDSESDGYDSDGSWDDADMNMSPIPTPTDPRLWHPRFQKEEEELKMPVTPMDNFSLRTPIGSGGKPGDAAQAEAARNGGEEPSTAIKMPGLEFDDEDEPTSGKASQERKRTGSALGKSLSGLARQASKRLRKTSSKSDKAKEKVSKDNTPEAPASTKVYSNLMYDDAEAAVGGPCTA